MKKFLPILLICALSLALYTACDKSSQSTAPSKPVSSAVSDSSPGGEKPSNTPSGSSLKPESIPEDEASKPSAKPAESDKWENTADNSSVGQAEKPSGQNYMHPAAENELISMLEQIQSDMQLESPDSDKLAVRLAASLMNWGVGTILTEDEIKDTVSAYYLTISSEEQESFSKKLALIDPVYLSLLGDDDQAVLDDADCDFAAYPWSEEPIETVETVMTAVLGER